MTYKLNNSTYHVGYCPSLRLYLVGDGCAIADKRPTQRQKTCADHAVSEARMESVYKALRKRTTTLHRANLLSLVTTGP